MSVRGALDAAYAMQARQADDTDRLNLLAITVGGGDASKYESARERFDRTLGLADGDVVEVAEYQSLNDLAAAKGWAV